MVVEPATSQALGTGGFVFVDWAVGEATPGSSEIPGGALAATATYIAANPAATRAAVEAMVDASCSEQKSRLDHPIHRKVDGTSVEKVRAVAEAEFVQNSPVISEAGWNALVKILRDGGVLKNDAPYSLLVATQFRPIWDRYAKEIATAPAK